MTDVSELAIAADYYALPRLAKSCLQSIQAVTGAAPAQACIALEAANGSSEAANGSSPADAV
eukprot:3070940-Rhodomonas_salina.2